MDQPFSHMSADKTEFIKKLAAEASEKSQSELFPFLLSIAGKSGRSGFNFSDEETELLIRQLTDGMPPSDRKKIEMFRKISSLLASKASRK